MGTVYLDSSTGVRAQPTPTSGMGQAGMSRKKKKLTALAFTYL